MQNSIRKLPGQRPSTWVYSYDNFRYHEDGRKLQITTYRCATRSQTECPALLYRSDDGTIKCEGKHTDVVDFSIIKNLQLKADIAEAFERDDAHFDDLVKELTERYSSFKSPAAIKKMLQRARPSVPIPHTVEEVASCMEKVAEGRAILKEVVTMGPRQAMILATDTMIKGLNSAHKLVINQVTNVLGNSADDSMWMMNVVLTKDGAASTFGSVLVYSREPSGELYELALTHNIQLAPGLKNVLSVVTTADRATVKATRTVLKKAQITIFWLDFVQSVCELWNSQNMVDPPLEILHSCWILGLCCEKKRH